jgi:hypothetical protein
MPTRTKATGIASVLLRYQYAVPSTIILSVKPLAKARAFVRDERPALIHKPHFTSFRFFQKPPAFTVPS